MPCLKCGLIDSLRDAGRSFFLVQAGAGGQKYVMRDLMRVLEQEKHAYSDPVTEVITPLARMVLIKTVFGSCQDL